MTAAPLERHTIVALAPLFPAWSDDRVIYSDDAIIVVDKPPFMSTHAPDAARADDVVSRLTAWLAERERAPYLGTHQRLDRDTSGVLLFSRAKAANPGLAKQFEGRTVKKTYLAVVEGELRLPRDGVLRHRIVDDKDGRVRALPPDDRARGKGTGQSAITRCKIIEKNGRRALVQAMPETGRTHQIRAQLAASGASIVGDVLYEGAPASRLMLHAQKLELRHPTTEERLELVAKTPPELELALRGGEARVTTALEIALCMRRSADRRHGLFVRRDTDAFRIVNGEGDGLPGVALDVYGDDLVVHLSDPSAPEDAILDAAATLGAVGVYVKRRPKDASRLGAAERDARAPRLPVRGEAAPDGGTFVIEELGVPYEVRLGDGLSTGIFLDQRENRRRAAELAKGGRVLNLFAYTGAFSVAAARGGADGTVAVDVSPSVCTWAEENLRRIGADPSRHTAVAADCFDYLAAAKKRRELFDLVILDPPSFSTTKTSRFSADGGYVKLAAASLGVVRAGGALLACTNHQGIVMAKLRRFLHEAARAAGVNVVQMKDLPPPEDFPPAPGREPHLKSVLVRVG